MRVDFPPSITLGDSMTPLGIATHSAARRAELGAYVLTGDWSILAQGEQVWLYRGEKVLASGWVDGVMPDGSAVWIQRHDAMGRTMFLREDVSAIVRGWIPSGT
ncbi:hypothetical protein ACIPWF_19330 [Paenarthrobacter sp. NPDC089989]|uniref:hypothetical protein n=1 Tax=unclassified Paenarthrobacter TaxID=2634190 RepID=UPI00380BF56E